ncbi:MAG: WXG100 family type VII secretion target [Oscillospiraceae bacterium]
MSRLMIDAAQVAREAELSQDNLLRMKTELNRLTASTQALCGAWSGQSAAQMRARMERCIRTLAELIQTIGDNREFFTKAAREFQNCSAYAERIVDAIEQGRVRFS